MGERREQRNTGWDLNQVFRHFETIDATMSYTLDRCQRNNDFYIKMFIWQYLPSITTWCEVTSNPQLFVWIPWFTLPWLILLRLNHFRYLRVSFITFPFPSNPRHSSSQPTISTFGWIFPVRIVGAELIWCCYPIFASLIPFLGYPIFIVVWIPLDIDHSDQASFIIVSENWPPQLSLWPPWQNHQFRRQFSLCRIWKLCPQGP